MRRTWHEELPHRHTLIYDHDIPLMRTIVDAAKGGRHLGCHCRRCGSDELCPADRAGGTPQHTAQHQQRGSLRFYAQFADVVVLARELNLEQVAEIYRHIREENICGPSGEQIRIEMFCSAFAWQSAESVISHCMK